MAWKIRKKATRLSVPVDVVDASPPPMMSKEVEFCAYCGGEKYVFMEQNQWILGCPDCDGGAHD